MEDEKLKSWTDKFNECLALEFTNPEYFKVHHILVLTFMLQTGRYTDSYREQACTLLKEFLVDPLAAPSNTKIAEINSALSSDKRQDNVFTKNSRGVIDASLTILDVSTESAEQYRKDVVAWAKAVLYEKKEL